MTNRDEQKNYLMKKVQSARFQWLAAIDNWYSLTNDEQMFFVKQLRKAEDEYADYTGEKIF